MRLGTSLFAAVVGAGSFLRADGALTQGVPAVVNPAPVPIALPSLACDSGCLRLAATFRLPNAVLDSAGPRYAPTQWKRGALIGAIVGTALGVLVLTQCDSDANADCPGWGRAVLVLGVSTGTGVLIGAMIKKSP